MLGVTGILVIVLIFFSLFYIGARLGQMQEEREERRGKEASELPTYPQC